MYRYSIFTTFIMESDQPWFSSSLSMLSKLLQTRSPSSLCLAMCWPTICSVGVSQVATLPSQGIVSSRVGWLLVSSGFSNMESTLFQPRARADLVRGTVDVVVEGV